jgi:hypothetical protein
MRFMVKLFGVVCVVGVLLLCVASPVQAVFEQPSQLSTNAGLVTPNTPFLWKAELALERLQEQLTFDDNRRVLLQLRHADERINEMYVVGGNTVPVVVKEYTDTLKRIKSNRDIDYATAKLVEERVKQQVISVKGFTDDDVDVNGGLVEAQNLIEQTEEHRKQFLSDEQRWWANFAKQYPVTEAPVTYRTYVDVDYGVVSRYVPEDTTIQVIVVTSDGTLVDKFILVNTENDIKISKGETTKPQQTYTFSIAEVKRYVEEYGSLLGVE